MKAFPPYPVCFEYSQPEDREHVLLRVQQTLQDIIGKVDFSLEVALGEAEANAYRHGTKVAIKINRIGDRLVIRVSGNGAGFKGNDAVATIRAAGIKETFEASLSNEHGRGIPIMLSMMDRVLYNKRGNEVMLIKKFNQQKMREVD